MDKQFADSMIEKFQKKFYGFAFSKTGNLNESEELAARIVCEAYTALRNVEGVYNWEGYMYRIASNVYAGYIKEKTSHETVSIDSMELSDDKDTSWDIIHKEELEILRREIAWLGKLHREIILLYYYHNKKIEEISKKLEIPLGTVKWYLFDAKKTIKEGMRVMRKSGNLGIEPIEFCSIGHDGKPGSKGDTSDFLNTKLRQNIAYAAYYEEKTIEEIAKELGVSPVFIEDEVACLEEWGFLDKMPKNKYRTNILINNEPMEAKDRLFEIDRQIAEKVCMDYAPLIIEKLKSYDKKTIYVPDSDCNYLLWSAICMTVKSQNFNAKGNKELLKGTNYAVKRKDGGEYIAFADVYQKEENSIPEKQSLYCCGNMVRDTSKYPICSWSLSSDFDTRKKGWQDNKVEEFEALYLYMTGKLPKNESTMDKYLRLYERGLIFNDNGKDKVNVIVVKTELDEERKLQLEKNSLTQSIPKMPDSLVDYIKQKSKEKLEIKKEYYPKHMHKLLEYYGSFAEVDVMQVLYMLVHNGTLKPLNEAQKKGVNIIVQCDILPENK